VMPALSVVVPAHNEEAFLEQAIADIVGGLRTRGESFEVVVVENGSTDATFELARAIAARTPELAVHHLPNADYGEALRTGLLAARGALVVMFDVDYYDLGFLDRARARMASGGPAVVVASKRAAGTEDTRPFARRCVTAGFALVLRFGFGLGVSDTHGMKAMRRREVDSIARLCRFGTDLFDTELVLRAERSGLEVAELPVAVEERRPSRTPVWRRIPRTVVGLARLRVMLARERRRDG
jgi:glycosyltransferase involved in cell wall biosynthesis